LLDLQNSDTTAPSGRELYTLQFSLQAASPENFRFTVLYEYLVSWNGNFGVVFPEKLAVTQLVSKIPTPYRTRRLIAVLHKGPLRGPVTWNMLFVFCGYELLDSGPNTKAGGPSLVSSPQVLIQ